MSRFHDEFFMQKGPKHDALVIKCVSDEGLKRIINSAGFDSHTLIDFETEVICKSGNFIIGYADLYIRILENGDGPEKVIELRAKKLIEDFHIPKQDAYIAAKRYAERSSTGILVECKPTISDFGAVIRQLKTYEDILKNRGVCRLYKIIATYNSPSKEVLEYLLHEGITVVVFEDCI